MMDVDKIAVFAGVGLAVAVGAFVLWGPSPKPRRRGNLFTFIRKGRSDINNMSRYLSKHFNKILFFIVIFITY